MALTAGDSTQYSAVNRLYDEIYAFKDYAGEAERVRELVRARAPHARTLLDVACGTGKHLEHLQRSFTVEGLDLDPELLTIARGRLPGVPLHQGDMTSFRLGRRFDAVTCLFSAIGYVTAEDGLSRAAAALADHLEPDGVLIVEPWISPDAWRDRHIGGVHVDEDELQAIRISLPRRDGPLSILELHYLIGTPDGVERVVEEHTLRLWRDDQYREAFERAGLRVELDQEGLVGRGLWICVRAAG